MDIAKIARLARLRLSEAEQAYLPAQLEAILGFAESLRAVDTEGIGETSAPNHLVDVLRPDVVQPSTPCQAILAMAVSRSDGYFAVPKTVG